MYTITEQQLTNLILEELTKGDVKSMISGELDSLPSDRKFRKEIKSIAVEVLEDFFKEMWRKNSFWKTALNKR